MEHLAHNVGGASAFIGMLWKVPDIQAGSGALHFKVLAVSCHRLQGPIRAWRPSAEPIDLSLD